MPNDTIIRKNLAALLAEAAGNPDRAITAVADGLRRGALTDAERREIEDGVARRQLGVQLDPHRNRFKELGNIPNA